MVKLVNELLGVKINPETKEYLYEKIIKLAQRSSPSFVVRPNAEIITYAQKDRNFREILNQAQLSIPDGIGVFLASKLLGTEVGGRFGGPDSMFEILKLATINKLSVYLLGSKNTVVAQAARNIKRALPGIILSGFHEGYFTNNQPIIRQLNELKPDIVFVGMGFPKQETWVWENLKKLKRGVFVMEGGSFDYISGSANRAPRLVQNFGLEWLYRLLRQPWRLKRQLKLFNFVKIVLNARLGMLPDRN